MLQLCIRAFLITVIVFAASGAAATETLNPSLAPLQEVVSDLYSYSLRIVGLAVFIMFLLAGLTYIVPGLQNTFGAPMKIIQDAVIGLVLLFSAYLILNTINPDLVGGTAQQPTQNLTPP